MNGKILVLIISAMLVSLMTVISVQAEEASYDINTGILTIPEVQVDGVSYRTKMSLIPDQDAFIVAETEEIESTNGGNACSLNGNTLYIPNAKIESAGTTDFVEATFCLENSEPLTFRLIDLSLIGESSAIPNTTTTSTTPITLITPITSITPITPTTDFNNTRRRSTRGISGLVDFCSSLFKEKPKPTLVIPINGIIVPYKETIRFSWKPQEMGKGAAYLFHLSRWKDSTKVNNTFLDDGGKSRCLTSSGCITTTTKDTFYDTYITYPNTTYYWRVRDSLNGNWSDWAEFKTSDGTTAGELADVVAYYDAQGGPPPSDIGDPNKGLYDKKYYSKTVDGTFTIDKCGPYPYKKKEYLSKYAYSNIRWGAPLENSTVVGDPTFGKLITRQLTEDGNDYATDWEEVGSFVHDTNSEILSKFNKWRPGAPTPTIWIDNSFGHMACYYNSPINEYIHTTDMLEPDAGANPKGNISPSQNPTTHGCIRTRPDDIDDMVNNGYLIGGSKFIVHEYKERFPTDKNKIFMEETGSHEYEVHFYPGQDTNGAYDSPDNTINVTRIFVLTATK
jgi:hypothetical protein